MTQAFPKLHNAMWPGLVGKGADSEPPIDLDTMLDLTAAAEVHGVRFDGVDIFLADPHTPIGASDDEIKRLADKVLSRGLVVGLAVAPVWPPVGGGSAMGDANDRKKYLDAVRNACRIMGRLRDLGARNSTGVIRIDTATSLKEWDKDPAGATAKMAKTMRDACDIAEDHGEKLGAEGEICWGGMHSWKYMIDLLEEIGRPETLGFHADMAHTLLFALGIDAPDHRIFPEDLDWSDRNVVRHGLKTLTDALRPWTVDLDVSQSDGTPHGTGFHEHTGRHCLPDDPGGKLDVVEFAGMWLNNPDGTPTKALRHICWDGCMFPNSTLMDPKTWNSVLATMIAVRDAHGWRA